MAVIKIIENVFEDRVNTFNAEAGRTVEDIIRENTSGEEYFTNLVECYDCETGRTFLLQFATKWSHLVF